MIEILTETTKNPITLIGQRAGICYGSDTTDDKANYNRGIKCLENNHGRVLEFVNVEMVISGYSARVIREWYTHIGGSPTRLQESTRYVNFKDGFRYTIPDSIGKNEEALLLYTKAMCEIMSCVSRLDTLCIPKEDIANVLPLGMKTKIVDKRNLRNLIEMSHQRLCKRAYWEYRDLFLEISNALADYSAEWKYIVDKYFVPKCAYFGKCTESNSCKEKRGK